MALPRHKYTDADDELIRDCWRQGTPVHAVATYIGVSNGAIADRARGLGCGQHPKLGKPQPQQPHVRTDIERPITLAVIGFQLRRLPGEPETGFWL